MNNKLILIKIIILSTFSLILSIAKTSAQNIISPRTALEQPTTSGKVFKISDVQLSIDSSVLVSTGAGGTKNYIKATINSIGIGIIQYKWVLMVPGNGSGNQPIPPSVVSGSLQVNGTGTDLLFTERQHVTSNTQRKLVLIITSPINLQSNQITF